MILAPFTEAHRAYLDGRFSLVRDIGRVVRAGVHRLENEPDEALKQDVARAALAAILILCGEEEQAIVEQYAAWKASDPTAFRDTH